MLTQLVILTAVLCFVMMEVLTCLMEILTMATILILEQVGEDQLTEIVHLVTLITEVGQVEPIGAIHIMADMEVVTVGVGEIN